MHCINTFALNVIRWLSYIPNWIIAIAAVLGLSTWRKKISYEKKMNIADDFHDTVYDFILKISGSVQILEFIKIHMQSYEENFKKDPQRQKTFNSGLHEFIETSGEVYSLQLKNVLESISIQHIYTLSTKICVLKMKNSDSALNCYRQLKWFYDTIEKTTIKLGMKSLYWENPEVKKSMDQLNELDIDQLKRSLDTAEHLMLEFSKENYK